MNNLIIWFGKFLTETRSPKNKTLSARISMLAFGIAIFTLIINKIIIPQTSFILLVSSYVGGIIFWWLLGFAGLVVAIRRELQQIILIKGNLAVFYGVLWCLFSWSLSLYIFTLFMQSMLNL